MTESVVESNPYLEDIKAHNGWWSGNTTELGRKMALSFRSDFHKFLDLIEGWQQSEYDKGLAAYVGQTGIGKTTLFKQAIGAILQTESFDVGNSADNFYVDSVSPTQILYVPVEESLYHLESEERALEELERIVDYFHERLAKTGEQKFIFLDDISSLSLSDARRERLVDLIRDRTYLFVTGSLGTQVDFEGLTDDDIKYNDKFHPIDLLPAKFIDYIKINTDELGTRLEQYQPSDGSENYIYQIRNAFGKDAFEDIVENLEQLYFEELKADRKRLFDLTIEYFRKGGLLYRPDLSQVTVDGPAQNQETFRQSIDEMVDELIESNLLVFLHKELAQSSSVKKAGNLHKLCSLAAQPKPLKYSYRDLSENKLDVDRRTVGSYLQKLEDALILKRSEDYSIKKHREARLFLRDPRHVVLLSQRKDNAGYRSFEQSFAPPEEMFERHLARTVGFDHASRLSFKIQTRSTSDTAEDVEYYQTEAGTLDYIIHDEGVVYPFVFNDPSEDADASEIATSFDPSVGSHSVDDITYEAPYRFVLTNRPRVDTPEEESLTWETDNGTTICEIPFWLFLLIC